MRVLFLASLFLTLCASASAACTSPAGVAGSWDFNVSKETYAFCDGTDWVNTTASGTGIVCPAPGIDSTLNYDHIDSVLRFCFNGEIFVLGSGITGDPCATEGAINYSAAYTSMQYCDGSNWQNW